MATNAMKTHLVRVASRGFSAQAAPNPSARAAASSGPSVKVLGNKVTVASQENGGGLSRVSIVFRAGSRNETPESRGAAAAVRANAGLKTSRFTQFGIIRNVQQGGASLSATGDRETTGFTLVALRDQVESLLPYLAQVACSPAFKPWELSDNLPLLKYQLALLTPQIRVVDILHKAAYRTGLGNSIFVKKDFLGKQDSETLKYFVTRGFTLNRAVVAGVNVDTTLLQDFASSLALESGDPIQGNGAYFGGEIRKDKYGRSTQVAIAAEGAGLKDPKAALTHAILQYALGVAPSVKWGSGASPLARAVSSAADGQAGASAINVSYSDSGLFGVVVSSSADAAGKAVEAAVKVLRGSITDADVARGKAQLKARVLSNADNSASNLEDIAAQAALTGSVATAADLVDAIDKIPASDVTNAARKIGASKLSLAAFGNLDNVPYLDQLK